MSSGVVLLFKHYLRSVSYWLIWHVWIFIYLLYSLLRYLYYVPTKHILPSSRLYRLFQLSIFHVHYCCRVFVVHTYNWCNRGLLLQWMPYWMVLSN